MSAERRNCLKINFRKRQRKCVRREREQRQNGTSNPGLLTARELGDREEIVTETAIQKESKKMWCPRRQVRKALGERRNGKLCQVTEIGWNTDSTGSDSWAQRAGKVGVCGHCLLHIVSSLLQCFSGLHEEKKKKRCLSNLKNSMWLS